MKFLYILSFVLLDAIVPRSCRNDNGNDNDYYYDSPDNIEADSLDAVTEATVTEADTIALQ